MVSFRLRGTLQHNSLVIPWDTHINLVVPSDPHVSIVVPSDPYISLVLSKDTHIRLVLPKDTQRRVIPQDTMPAEYATLQVRLIVILYIKSQQSTIVTSQQSSINSLDSNHNRSNSLGQSIVFSVNLHTFKSHQTVHATQIQSTKQNVTMQFTTNNPIFSAETTTWTTSDLNNT